MKHIRKSHHTSEFERIIITYQGHIEVDFKDMYVTEIKDGDMVKVDLTNLSSTEVLDGIRYGKYYLSLAENLKVAIDGEDVLEAELES